MLHRTKYCLLFKAVCARLGWMAREILPNMGDKINFRIDLLLRHMLSVGLIRLHRCNISFSLFYSDLLCLVVCILTMSIHRLAVILNVLYPFDAIF